jgi:AraC family transcriptional regulator, ethanolamine operon transcriptional activator
VEPPVSTAEPAVTVVEISDLSAAMAGMELIRMDGVQLESMPLRARRVIIRLDSAVVVFHSTNRRVRTRTSVREGLLAYATYGPQAEGTMNGLPVRPGMMLAAAPGAEAGFVANAGWESITILLPLQDMAAHLASRRREDEFRLPQGIEILQADADKARGLFDLGKRMVDMAVRQPSLFNEQNRVRSAAQAELLETLLAAIGTARDFEPARSDRTRQTHNLIVKIAEDHALSNVTDHPHVTDLCKAAGVSERTLQNAFMEVMGLTPVAYLIRVRLHRARRALLAATQGSTTVSVEALNSGFWHFGEFSRAYKDCFGELPSDTLRRKPGEQQR